MTRPLEHVSSQIGRAKEKVAPITRTRELEEWPQQKRLKVSEEPVPLQWSSRGRPPKSSRRDPPQSKAKIGGEDNR